MVRNIAGLLVDVGRGQIKLEDISGIIESKDRNKSGMGAPPQGLCLCYIQYSENDQCDSESDGRDGGD